MIKKSIVFVFLVFQMMALPLNAGDVFKGREIYLRECMSCHGATGEGKLPGLPNFKEDQTLFKTDSKLSDIVSEGRGIMPGFSGLLTDQDIRNVVTYLRTFL